MEYKIEVLLETLERTSNSLIQIMHDDLKEIKFRLRYCCDGRLRISKRGNNYQYYLLEEEHPKGRYLQKKKYEHLIESLIKKKYYTLMFKKLTKELKALRSFQKTADFCFMQKICEKVEKGMRPYVQDIYLDRKQFSENWRQSESISRNSGFHEDNLVHNTSFGLKVRSKSEVMIAEALYRRNIPFRYEAPVFIGKDESVKVHPDFTCLNPRTCKEIIWEHLGKMDDPEYAGRVVAKMNQYAEGGHRLGENLCITMETGEHQLTMDQIEQQIRMYLE